MGDYTIQRGDCLWNIAKKQYSDRIKNTNDIRKAVDELAKANNISNPNKIYAGNTLVLPDSASIFGQKTDENVLLDTTIVEEEPTGTVLDTSNAGNEPTGTVLDLSQYTNHGGGTVLDLSRFVNHDNGGVSSGNLYEKFVNWTGTNTDDFYKNGENKDPEALRAGYDEIEGRIFNFNKAGSQNPRQDGVLEMAEGQMASYDTTKDGYIDFNEYLAGNLNEANSQYTDYTLTMDDETYQTLKNSFEFYDFNHDNKLESNELKAYYNIVDSSDGEQDGTFTFLQYMHWGQIASTEGETRNQYKEMLDNLFKESYPSTN